jgi:ribosome biogenesis GTPase
MSGVFPATITGKMRFSADNRLDLPAVGDWVAISSPDQHNRVIEDILARRTNLRRSAVGKIDVQIIAANVDVAFVVVAADRDFRINRIDRYLALILDGGIMPVVVLNKCDLIDSERCRELELEVFKRHPAVEVISTSLVSMYGLDALSASVKPGQTCCMVGSSGVGKSSLINYLAGEDLLKTSGISSANNRGRHTTTNRQLHLMPNKALLLDTPGMREVAMSDAEAGVGETFSQIEALALQCHFKDCTHKSEPGCAVIVAIAAGDLAEESLQSYQKLLRESRRFEEKIADRRRKEKDFGKMAKEVVKMKKILKG